MKTPILNEMMSFNAKLKINAAPSNILLNLMIQKTLNKCLETFCGADENNFTCCTHKIKFYFIHFSFRPPFVVPT